MKYELRFHGARSSMLLEGRIVHYLVNEVAIADFFGQVMPPRLADLVEIASAMYAADRRCLRPCSVGRSPHRSWARAMKLIIPVRDVAFWNASETRLGLEDLFRFMTGDVWSFTFEGNVEIRHTEAQQHFAFGDSESNCDIEVCLFSGGLDSYAGVLHRLQSSSTKRLYLVSGAGNSRLAARQRELVETIRRHHPGRVGQMSIPYAVFGQEDREESSQRTRGVLYLALGVVAALLARTNKLFVYENGIGALNLRFDGSQLGLQNSRPVHPITLHKFGQLISQISGADFIIENPFVGHTKAELCRQADGPALREGLKRTWSCDHAPRSSDEQWHCGRCTSCLLRRSSIFSAGLQNEDSSAHYKVDVVGEKKLPEIKKFEMRKTEFQATAMNTLLKGAQPWIELKVKYPLLARAATILDAQRASDETPFADQTTGLYQRYVHEWKQFPGRRQIRRSRKPVISPVILSPSKATAMVLTSVG